MRLGEITDEEIEQLVTVLLPRGRATPFEAALVMRLRRVEAELLMATKQRDKLLLGCELLHNALDKVQMADDRCDPSVGQALAAFGRMEEE